MLDDHTRARYKRSQDFDATLAQTQPDWQQLDELLPFFARLQAANAKAKALYDALTTYVQRDDAALKAENRSTTIQYTMQVVDGLSAWAAAQGPAQQELHKSLNKVTASVLRREDELDYAQLVEWVAKEAAPRKAALVKYFVPTTVTDQLSTLAAQFAAMRGDGRLTITQASAARKSLKELLRTIDHKKTGLLAEMKPFLRPFRHGNPELYQRLTNVLKVVDSGGPAKAKSTDSPA